jgi:hypothetical protein
MKTLRRLSAVVVLTLAFTLTAFAGEVLTPPCAPGEVLTPPCATSQVATDDSTQQTVSVLNTNNANDFSVSDFAVDLLRDALSIF